ncbi:MAG: hypothetical protein N3C12_12525 [Candidatus Binatia bacterium]|nr:hypothetical protein [Candidatus Binatia bacterium]
MQQELPSLVIAGWRLERASKIRRVGVSVSAASAGLCRNGKKGFAIAKRLWQGETQRSILWQGTMTIRNGSLGQPLVWARVRGTHEGEASAKRTLASAAAVLLLGRRGGAAALLR